MDRLLGAFGSNILSVLRFGRVEGYCSGNRLFFGLLMLHQEDDRSCCPRIGPYRLEGDDP